MGCSTFSYVPGLTREHGRVVDNPHRTSVCAATFVSMTWREIEMLPFVILCF